MSINESDPYLSITEIADQLQVSTQTIRRWDKHGDLKPARRLPSGVRQYLQYQVDEMIQRMSTREIEGQRIGTYILPGGQEHFRLLTQEERQISIRNLGQLNQRTEKERVQAATIINQDGTEEAIMMEGDE